VRLHARVPKPQGWQQRPRRGSGRGAKRAGQAREAKEAQSIPEPKPETKLEFETTPEARAGSQAKPEWSFVAVTTRPGCGLRSAQALVCSSLIGATYSQRRRDQGGVAGGVGALQC